MTKKPLLYKDQVNFLAVEGTLQTLVSIAFYRGDKGKLGTAARDMMSIGIDSFLKNLSPKERARYDEILSSVKIASAMRSDNPSG